MKRKLDSSSTAQDLTIPAAMAPSDAYVSEAKKGLRVVFAGTPDFAAVALEALMDSTHEVMAVFTQPDRPSGRGLKIKSSPVKELAMQHKIPLYQPVSLNDEQAFLTGIKVDVMVVAAYGALLPVSLLNIPRFGCINIHPSLLPRWRGAAPIQRAIYANDAVSGVTIMQMDQGLDTGPILLQQSYVLEPNETYQTLHDKLAKLGASALIETLDLLAQNKVKPIPQDETLATYAHKVSKEEALIDWTLAAIEIECAIRAFNPWPVAYTSWQGKDLRIWEAKAVLDTPHKEPRTIIRASQKGIDIATGDGILRLLKVQMPGKKILSIADFYNAKSKDLIEGEHFI